MVTFSIRTVFWLTAAIATIYPVVRSSSFTAFAIWLIVACVFWGVAGRSLRTGNSYRKYFPVLCIVPLLIAFADNLSVAVCDDWLDVTVNTSIPADADPSTTTLHYVALPQRTMLPFVLEHDIDTQEAVAVKDIAKPVSLRTGYSWRCSQFGNTWAHGCEYDTVVFLATMSDGSMRHGVVELPNRYDPTPYAIKWKHATEQRDAVER